MTVRKLLPISGIVFVLLIGLSVVVGGGTPSPDASASEVMSFYDAHHAREIAAAFVLAASVPFLVFFAGALVTALWPDGGGTPIWELVLVAGSVLAGAALLLGATVHFALADGAGDLSLSGLQVLNAIDGDFWMALNAGVAVMLFGAAGSILTRTLGYRPLGWVALALGVVLFVPFASFFALLASAVWIVATSIVLLRGGSVARYAPAPGVA